MNIKLICVGSLKEKFFKDAIAEYSKRLIPFCNFEVVEIPECRLVKNFSDSDINLALEKEGKSIIAAIPKSSYVIALCVEGKEFNSIEFSQKLEEIRLSGKSSIVFIIGSSFGLSKFVKDNSDMRFSVSRLTLPHQLARVFLVEQIYRAFQIIIGGKYHK